MIEIRGLTHAYGSLLAVDGLDLKVEQGEIFGFVGPNGAGKTTTIRILATLIRPTRGEALVGGHSVRRSPAQVRRIIGYLPDTFGVYEDLVVEEYLSFFAATYGIRGAAATRVVDDVLSLTELGGKRRELVGALSRGMQQRLGLARVLVHNPDVLLLDEPASGLDPLARIEVRELVKELGRMGKTVLISSHILHELGDLCDKVGIIERGRLLCAGPVPEVARNLQLQPVILLRVDPDHQEQALALVAALATVESAVVEDGFIRVRLSAENPEPWRIPEAVVQAGLRLHHYQEQAANLEEVFLHITRGLVQ